MTRWSSRLLARELGISSASIIGTWQKWKLQPWRRESFKFSTDPQLEAKLTDVVGLYLNPPENAVVICVYEKSQALDRTQPIRPGLPEKATHDHVRHGTRNSSGSSRRSPPPTPAAACVSSATTTPRTSTRQ